MGKPFVKLDCKDCNGIGSDVPFDKQTVTIREFDTQEERTDAIIKVMKDGVNTFPECLHCKKQLTPNFE